MNPSSMIPLVLFLVPLALLTVGAVLVSIGRRGRAVDNHPICGKCGFDLFGLAELTKCPECGTELSAKVVRLGHRKVRKLALTLGLIMLVPSLLVLSIVTIATVRRTDMNRYKPLWWLLREADSPALTELKRRLVANQFDAAQIDRVTAAALSAQADMARPFLVEWGNFVEAARRLGKVDDESWKRFARQAVPLTLVARANVRRGDPLPIRIDYGPVRLGLAYQFRADVTVLGSTLSGVPLAGMTRTNMGIEFGTRGPDLYQNLTIPPDKLASLSDGRNALNVRVRVTIEERTGFTHKNLTTQDIQTSSSLNLVPADQSTVQVITDPSLRSDVEASLALHGYRSSNMFLSGINPGVGRFLHIGKDQWGNDRPEFLVQAERPPPIGLAYDVAVVDRAGRAWPSDTITIDAGANWGTVCTGGWDGFNADRVEVVLKPNPAAAAGTVGITKIWGGTIRFKDVPVVWDKEAHRPTTLPTSARARRPATMTTRITP